MGDSTLLRDDGSLSIVKGEVISQCIRLLQLDESIGESDGLGFAGQTAIPLFYLENKHFREMGEMVYSTKILRQLRDVKGDGSRSLIRFLAKRASCDCLQEMYKRVKTHTKMGVCYHCESYKEFMTLGECGRCGVAHYCNRNCQVADWPNQKSYCKEKNEPRLPELNLLRLVVDLLCDGVSLR